ncbi:porin family protein [Hymenobacter actinosclerus]|uniref:Outer membrane protein beta-barrel domain-containing protein n=1 Tax=Hymenobacter actinosclerus TaxID=82805 RepID=A0A1I0IEP8_9BACT|nr:porin family protein [Hymenobacter actinosclerus]SET94677.1 Outer membrane protein beta-barrel domain-containing protein [Hymenobacter actinosclerus]
MKKALLALVFSAAAIGTASAQVEIGLKVSPSLTSLRASSPNGDELKNENAKLSLGGGLIVDYFFGQNYAFSTGLELVGKGGKVSYFDGASQRRYEQKLGLQYLQVPLTVKLFTNDVAEDTKVYFQLGGALGGVIGARVDGDKYYTSPASGNRTKATKHAIIPDANLRLGAGIERQLGQSTKFLAGISYHRGLLNIDKYFEDKLGIKNAELKNSEFALDLGIKF